MKEKIKNKIKNNRYIIYISIPFLLIILLITAKVIAGRELYIDKLAYQIFIEKLRNDSSLRFYNQRASFCHNGSYGYINSQYEVVIEPIYSFADIFIAIRYLKLPKGLISAKATLNHCCSERVQS